MSQKEYAIIFGFILFIIGAGLFYLFIASLFNKTVVVCEKNKLTIKIEPFPLIKKEEYLKEQILQIYCEQIEYSGRNGKFYYYTVLIADTKKKHKAIFKNIYSLETARKIEREIENFLNIENTIMPSEYQD